MLDQPIDADCISRKVAGLLLVNLGDLNRFRSSFLALAEKESPSTADRI